MSRAARSTRPNRRGLGYTSSSRVTESIQSSSVIQVSAPIAGRTIIAAKLFVGNLNFRTTRDELQELFSQVGEVVDVFLPLDRQTGKPRGFGFVEYADEAAAREAIQKFDGHELQGRTLRVNEAEAKPQRAPRPSPGFRRDSDGGGFYGPSDRPSRPKGSRRNARGKKRSL